MFTYSTLDQDCDEPRQIRSRGDLFGPGYNSDGNSGTSGFAPEDDQVDWSNWIWALVILAVIIFVVVAILMLVSPGSASSSPTTYLDRADIFIPRMSAREFYV